MWIHKICLGSESSLPAVTCDPILFSVTLKANNWRV